MAILQINMCGITGFIQPIGFQSAHARETVIKQANTLTHRGPDDAGVWIDEAQCIALAHRRLSIQDLSPAGHQPMTSSSGRYVLVFNGEIYNHLDIRKEIETTNQIPWRGHSDTESFLAGFECWGIKITLEKTVGMFAFALWDRRNQVLTLGRDRMGEKPLYYGWQNNVFMFGSELRSLRAHPVFENDINRDVLPHFLQYGYIPAPHSIYNGIRKLLPGTYVEIPGSSSIGALTEPQAYWSLNHVAEKGIANPFIGSDSDLIDELETRLIKTLKQQRIADVPLGAFLSGGTDSSIITAILQSQSMRPIKTFTIGFNEEAYNEAGYAKKVADHLGTDHTTLYLSSEEILENIPSLHELYDEPFSDSSASMMISKLARQEVKVALSGDGGDESFGGYSAYHMMNSLWNKHQVIPDSLRPIISKSILSLSPATLTNFFSPFLNLIGRNTSIPSGQRLHQLATGLNCKNPLAFFHLMKTYGGFERTLIQGTSSNTAMSLKEMSLPGFKELYSLMMYSDSLDYLPDDILVKVDRASMSVSLETRAPLLDHRIVEFAWTIPGHKKIHNGEGKWPLRQLLNRYVPEKLMDRPKMGFNLPISEWLRGPLKNWSGDLLNEQKILSDGYFDAGNVQKILKQHHSGKHNWQAILWRIIAFQAWLAKS